ncbi:MAG: nuclear transport factor 2 family protein [Anaerolineales bacterium]
MDFEKWVQGYLKAWKTNECTDIEALFTEEATYLTQAFREPWKGREMIVNGWLERAGWQGQWSFEYEWVAIEGNVGVLEGVTTYQSQGSAYNNIWVIVLDADGLCCEFREQWVQKPETE